MMMMMMTVLVPPAIVVQKRRTFSMAGLLLFILLLLIPAPLAYAQDKNKDDKVPDDLDDKIAGGPKVDAPSQQPTVMSPAPTTLRPTGRPSERPTKTRFVTQQPTRASLPTAKTSSIPSRFPSPMPAGIPSPMPADIPSPMPAAIPSPMPAAIPSYTPLSPVGTTTTTEPTAAPFPDFTGSLGSDPSLSPTSNSSSLAVVALPLLSFNFFVPPATNTPLDDILLRQVFVRFMERTLYRATTGGTSFAFTLAIDYVASLGEVMVTLGGNWTGANPDDAPTATTLQSVWNSSSTTELLLRDLYEAGFSAQFLTVTVKSVDASSLQSDNNIQRKENQEHGVHDGFFIVIMTLALVFLALPWTVVMVYATKKRRQAAHLRAHDIEMEEAEDEGFHHSPGPLD